MTAAELKLKAEEADKAFLAAVNKAPLPRDREPEEQGYLDELDHEARMLWREYRSAEFIERQEAELKTKQELRAEYPWMRGGNVQA